MSLASLPPTEEDVDTTYSLHELVITGTRTPKLLSDSPVQTRVITSQDIQKADATNIQDLLQTELPGVEFSYAMNQRLHLNMSGFGGQGILFLVDGEQMAGETMDDIDFTRLFMGGVERVELVKGASSALYGSNAGGGVVNIITSESRQPWAWNVNTRFARHNEQRYGTCFSTSGKYASNMLNADYHNTDNFNVDNGPTPQAHVFSTVYGNETFNVRDKFVLRPWEELKLTARAGYFYRTLSRTPDTPERYRDFSAGLRAQWDITPADHLDVAYSFDQYDKSNYQRITKLDLRDYSNVQNSTRALYTHNFDDDIILTLGGATLHDYLFTPRLQGNKRWRDCMNVFGQLDWNIDERWELIGTLRYDYFSSGHNSRVTPKLSARYLASRSLTLRAGYGMGFRSPTLKEKYYNFDMAGIWIIQGNPQLKPEVSHNINISMEWTKNRYNFTAATFYNRVSDKLTTGIPFYKPGDDTQLYLDYLNLKDYAVCGLETTLQARWSNGFHARLSYAYTIEHNPKDSKGNTVCNQYIPARHHSLNTRLEWNRQFSKNYGLSLILNGRFLSSVDNVEYADYYDISQGTLSIRYPAYTLWKFSAAQRMGKAVKLILGIDNIFNYRPQYYYMNAPVTDGTNLQVGLSLDIDKL